MSAPCPLFVELCAGTAAVTLRLLGGKALRPAVGMPGCKQGYAHAILHCMGLRSGQGAQRAVLAEAGPWALVHAAMFSKAGAQAVSRRTMDHLAPANNDHKAHWLWTRELFDACLAAGVTHDEIPVMAADWLYLCCGSYNAKGPSAGVGWAAGKAATKNFSRVRPSAYTAHDWSSRWLRQRPWQTPVWTVQGDAAKLVPPWPLPAGTRVYIDPPYAGTTGYQHTMSRVQVIDTACRWASAGARVYVSEAEPLPIAGWHHVDITTTRTGKRRTYGDTKEWLTMSHPPPWRPQVQAALL